MNEFDHKVIDIGLMILREIVQDETVTKHRKQKALNTICSVCTKEISRVQDLRPWKPKRKLLQSSSPQSSKVH